MNKIVKDLKNENIKLQKQINELVEYNRLKDSVDVQLKKLSNENEIFKKQLKTMSTQDSIKDEMFIQQAKMASMGEMISNIAHQWRQPLMEVSSLMINMEAKITLLGEITASEVLTVVNETTHILKFMSNTIDDFRNFFATDKEKEYFLITEQVSFVLNMMTSILLSNNIKVNVIIKNNIKIYGFKNEYSQALINIISNAKNLIFQR